MPCRATPKHLLIWQPHVFVGLSIRLDLFPVQTFSLLWNRTEILFFGGSDFILLFFHVAKSYKCAELMRKWWNYYGLLQVLLRGQIHRSDIKLSKSSIQTHCEVYRRQPTPPYILRVRDGNSPCQQVALVCMHHSMKEAMLQRQAWRTNCFFLFCFLSTVSHSFTANYSDLSHRHATPPILNAQSS